MSFLMYKEFLQQASSDDKRTAGKTQRHLHTNS